jgi:hypothetical protein
MNIVGEQYLQTCISQTGYFLKLVLNERSAHFFPYSNEHRDASLPGLKYCDDSGGNALAGNALAATIKPTQIDIRLHAAFSSDRVRAIVAQLESTLGDSPNAIVFDVNYGGQPIASIKIPTSTS